MNHATKKPASRAVKTTKKAAKAAAREEQPIPLVPTDKPLPAPDRTDLRLSAVELAETVLEKLTGEPKGGAGAAIGMLHTVNDELEAIRLALWRAREEGDLAMLATAVGGLQTRIGLVIELHTVSCAEVD